MMKRRRTLRVTSYKDLTQLEAETSEERHDMRQTRSRTRSHTKPQSDNDLLSHPLSDSHIEGISAELHYSPEHLDQIQGRRISSEEFCGGELDEVEAQASTEPHQDTLGKLQASPLDHDHTPQFSQQVKYGNSSTITILNLSGDSRGTRGFTRLSHIWNLPEGYKIGVQFNRNLQPIKREGGLLMRFLGTCVRRPNLAPINFKSWLKVPSTFKEELWDLVKSKFEIPIAHEAEIRKFLIQKAGYMWRGHKSHLRSQYFDEDKSVEEMVANVPPRVDQEQWASLVALWNTSDMKALSQNNKALRKLQKVRHTSGSKSFAEVAEEKKEKDGVEPTEAELYILTHKPKDATALNDEAAKKIAEMEKLAAQRQDNPQSSNEDADWQHDVDGDGYDDDDDIDGDYAGTHSQVVLEGNEHVWGLRSGITPRKTSCVSPAVASTRSGSDTRQVDMEVMRGPEDSSQVEKDRTRVVKDRRGKDVIDDFIPPRNTSDFSPIVTIARLVSEENDANEERMTAHGIRTQVVENRTTREKERNGPDHVLNSGRLPSKKTSRLPPLIASARIVPPKDPRQVDEARIRAYAEGRKRIEEDRKRVEEDRRKVEEERKQVEEERRQAREDRRKAEEEKEKYEAEICFLRDRLTWMETLVSRLLPSADSATVPREVPNPRSDPNNRTRMFSATSSHAQDY